MSGPVRSLKRPRSLSDIITTTSQEIKTTSTEALQYDVNLFYSTNDLISSHERQEDEDEDEDDETDRFSLALSNVTLQSSRDSFHSVSSMDVDENISPDSAIAIPHFSFHSSSVCQEQQQINESVLVNHTDIVPFELQSHQFGSEHTNQNPVMHDAPVAAHMTDVDNNKEQQEKRECNVTEIFLHAKQD